MNEWQPIESAPKMENMQTTKILLFFAGGQISVGYWDDYYAKGGRGFTGRNNAWVEPCSGDTLDAHYDSPTHWMPLPEPPQ